LTVFVITGTGRGTNLRDLESHLNPPKITILVVAVATVVLVEREPEVAPRKIVTMTMMTIMMVRVLKMALKKILERFLKQILRMRMIFMTLMYRHTTLKMRTLKQKKK